MNPYKVLGVPEGADEDTIKNAYREMVKKYHPDKYINNPLADLAEEKMKEINEAYNMLTGGNTSQSYNSTYDKSYSSSSSPGFAEIRRMISEMKLEAADQMLDKMNHKPAEWHFLKGIIHQRRGWYESALKFFNTAVSLDPNNMEYRAALNSIVRNVHTYRNVGTGGSTALDCCTSLVCADCLCECCGGDLIRCC
jgi:molecular chaperone DnaJ